MEFIHLVRDEIFIKRRRGLVLDFTPIQSISTDSALLLVSEMDRWRRATFQRRLRAINVDKWHPSVRTTLRDLGFFELLRLPNWLVGGNAEAPDGSKILKFRAGTGYGGKLAREVRIALEQIAGPIQTANFLHDGITEAMLNARHHAYPGDFRPEIPVIPEFWVTGAWHPAKRLLRIMVLDQGVGIPESIRQGTDPFHVKVMVWVAQKANLRNDADIIEGAMRTSRTSTGLAGRGHGFDNMAEFINNSADGRLRILSDRGEVVYEHGGTINTRLLPVSLGGTLIEWEVRL